ncbi:hypothetical protein Slin15195_G056400 [Septoria linicola]|uniref:Uncharacterized protein n=1 Tax=Septoria linicola TaxID=215465 RepID=A0A9Q9EHZ9_9PEZI|nr:hypothetical protein Slin14017_G072280 [Septoria linicola]USW52321.1 hypothetical protein Slin15195_G056400 [Septoria linicola]
MALRHSYDRSTGKIPLSVILNEVEHEPRVSAPRSLDLDQYRSQQTSSHGSSPTSSLGSPPPQLSLHHSGSTVQSSTATFPRDPYNAQARESTSIVDEQRPQLASWSNGSMADRRPRPPRPSYSEEQKFFIMYARIIRDNTWPEIEDRFDKLFGMRTKGGLTSVYYRVRREWGLMEVLKSGPGSYAADCREVEQRAMNFSREFLSQIGYLPSAN